MKKLLSFSFFLLAAFSMFAQSYRIEGGQDVYYIVQSYEKAYADGDKNVDEVWTRAGNLDSLKVALRTMYLTKQETQKKYQASADLESEGMTRLRELMENLNKSGAMAARTTNAPVKGLEPGVYKYDGKVFTPHKEESAKAATPPAKKKKQ